MTNLLEITAEDIAMLGDADLRDLIGLLCEADFRSAGLPTKSITWGGHQDAADGGFDVVINSDVDPPSNSFIPRRSTAFQVKRTDMPRAEIIREMQPNGTLREEIKNLIREGGAYIIVSSTGSTTDKALKSRRAAMNKAIEDAEDHTNLFLDFMDRGRVATWVRSHPSLILWVRDKIGRQLKGWRPYENWANAPGGIEEEYLLDDTLRIHDGMSPNSGGTSVVESLQRLRIILQGTSKSVRLAGLSGVGKTRLVQALFDERVGEDALNRTFAFYTDVSDTPEPDPRTFAEQLIAIKIKAILVVDNCPRDLHRRLTQICAATGSMVSLITIEYDIRDDLPEETHVFRMEPASEGVIEKLIRKRFKYIGQVDARTIASFSGGNARVAISLATTVQQGETLSRLRDEDLFQRLFWQRNNPSESLMHSAEVCSLVYSFDGDDVTSSNSELKFLASLIGKSSVELYRDVNTLKGRDLVQSRHIWRAVLPHAIANRLARQSLESIPKEILVSRFVSQSERLIISFSRRLGYLHDCQTAVEIATEWLAPDGWLGKAINNFNPLGITMFRNIAPLAPEETLSIIEHAANGEEGQRFTSREVPHFYEFVRLLRHLAYDPALFPRSVAIMCRYALTERPNENNSSTRDILKSLFYINYSGSLASIDARTEIIKELIYSEDEKHQELGILLLAATLETHHFRIIHEFEFGARSRNYGYIPQSRQDIVTWFSTFIELCTHLAISKQPIAELAKGTLASCFRGLWSTARMLDELEKASMLIHAQKPWNEGWLAVRSVLRYGSKNSDAVGTDRLRQLEQNLKPADLLEQARIYALSGQPSVFFDLDDDYEGDDATIHSRSVEQITHQLGMQVASNDQTFISLLPDIVSSYSYRLGIFGSGLAAGSPDRQYHWQALYSQLKKTPPEKRQINILVGFLSECSKRDPAFYNSIMDSLITDGVLGEYFPILQINTSIDERGLQRLHEALANGIAPVRTYEYLKFHRRHEIINDNDLSNLVRKIMSKFDGIYIAVEILVMRFHRPEIELPNYSSDLIAIAKEVLATFPFAEDSKRWDHELAEIADACLQEGDGINTAVTVCSNFAEALNQSRVYTFDYPNLLSILAQRYPACFMDMFLEDAEIAQHFSETFTWNESDIHQNPFNQIPDQIIINWCEHNPDNRYIRILETIDTYHQSTETGNLVWKPIVHTILEKAPILAPIMHHLSKTIYPHSWSGSQSEMLQKRSQLLQSLYQHDNAEISSWAKAEYLRLQEEIKRAQEYERISNRRRVESFE